MCHRLMLAVGLATLAAGCGGPANVPPSQDHMEQTSLNDVGELYRVYSVEKKKPPTRLADFAPFEMMNPTGYLALKDGSVVAQLGAAMPDLEEGPSKGTSPEVLAYQKQVPEQGGYVLMLDRTVKKMTAEEFKAAPKPAGTSTAPAAAKKK